MTATVLIVEDELLVAMDIQFIAEEMGYAVAGPCPSLAAAARLLEAGAPDAAVLHVRLTDGEVFPLADRLRDMGVPIIFHSGHADEPGLLARYPGSSVCAKPYAPGTLRAALKRATGEAA